MSGLLYDSRESGGRCESCTPPPRVPPFAPQPLNGPLHPAPPVSTVTCNAHEVCHYLQQVLYVSAILTGIALVIAGAIQTGASSPGTPEEGGVAPGSDLLVFVYIGVLLIGVNVSLLLLQCYMRSKELQRARRNQRAQPVRYNPLVALPNPPVRPAESTAFLQPDSRLWVGPAPSVQSAATAPTFPGTRWPLVPGVGPASR